MRLTCCYFLSFAKRSPGYVDDRSDRLSIAGIWPPVVTMSRTVWTPGVIITRDQVLFVSIDISQRERYEWWKLADLHAERRGDAYNCAITATVFAILQAIALSLLRDHGTFSGGIVHRENTAYDVVSVVTACKSFAREVIDAYRGTCLKTNAKRCSPLALVPPTRFLGGAELYHGNVCTHSPGAVTRFLYVDPVCLLTRSPSPSVCNRGVIVLYITRITP